MVALTVLRVEFIAIILLPLAFIIIHSQTRWWEKPVGRQLMLIGVVAIVEGATLLAVSMRVQLSLWIFVIVYAFVVTSWAGWTIAIIRVRLRAAREEDQRDKLSAT